MEAKRLFLLRLQESLWIVFTETFQKEEINHLLTDWIKVWV